MHPGATSPQDVYPGRDTHQWNEFPLLAMETGGYRDATVTDPYSGRRMWVGGVFLPENNIYDSLRAVIDEMEKHEFLGPMWRPAPFAAPQTAKKA